MLKHIDIQVANLSIALQKLKNLECSLLQNPNLLKTEIFFIDRDEILNDVLACLPDNVGAFEHLDGRVIRNRFKVVWRLKQAECYLLCMSGEKLF